MKKIRVTGNQKRNKPKSMKEIIENAYKIAEESGFYIPINKNEWIDS